MKKFRRNVLTPPDVEGPNYITLGAGVSSSTMLLMALHEEITPMPKLAIFADTGWERPSTLETVEFLREYAEGFGVPVITINNGANIKEDAEGGDYFAMPFYYKNLKGKPAKGARQCTYNHKIAPVNKIIRSEGANFHNPAICWVGFTSEELGRVSDSRVKYIVNRWPLIEKRMRRRDCIEWLIKNEFDVPRKSGCVGCPIQGNGGWKNATEEEMKEVLEFDEKIRHISNDGREVFLHWSCKPIKDIDFKEDENLFDEVCGGSCFT